MIIKRKFITYYMPGSFFPESQTVPVESFDIPKEIPRDCYAFKFHETEYAAVGKKEYEGDTTAMPETHYIGRVVHHDDIPDTEENRILRSNIRGNSPTNEAIKTHLGNWQPADENAVIHDPSEFAFTKPLIYKNIKSQAA